ncbi:MAG: hypothetical protein PHV30_09145 [Candidatus Margulisbacteria bacterium]|nr:hypothetical protein [Candidatus Margulisiibacteriota bacterium]
MNENLIKNFSGKMEILNENKKRMKLMSKNSKFLLISILLILITGCININVTPQNSGQNTPETTSNFFKTTKNIDTSRLDSEKIILSETETKEVLGPDWIQKANQNNNIYSVRAYEKQNTYYKKPPYASIGVFVMPNTTSTYQLYEMPFPGFNATPTEKISLGDSGKIFQTTEGTMIIFKQNTIVVTVSTSTDLDTAKILAEKQEAKIKGIISKI